MKSQEQVANLRLTHDGVMEKCPDCQGTGFIGTSRVVCAGVARLFVQGHKCERCNGKKVVMAAKHDPEARP